MNTLRWHRFIRGYSQARLGLEAGLDPAIISRLENNLYRNTKSVIIWKKKIAGVLAVRVDELFPGILAEEGRE